MSIILALSLTASNDLIYIGARLAPVDACREDPVYLTGSFDNSFIALNLDRGYRFEADYDGLPKNCILNSRARGWVSCLGF